MKATAVVRFWVVLLCLAGVFVLAACASGGRAAKPMKESAPVIVNDDTVTEAAEDPVLELEELPHIEADIEVFPQQKHAGRINSIAYSPDGNYLASSASDHTIKLWDVVSGRELRTLKGHSNVVNSISFSPDGNYLVSGSFDKTARIWNWRNGQEIGKHLRNSSITAVTYSPDGTFIVMGDKYFITKWNLTDEKVTDIGAMSREAAPIVFSPDGKRIATPTDSIDCNITIWNVEASIEQKPLVLSGHGDRINALAFSPDGKHIVSGSGSGTMTGLSIGNRKRVWDKDNPHDHSIRVWDIESGRQLMLLSGHTRDVLSVSYSPDGKHILSGSDEGTVRIWDAVSGQELKVYKITSNIYQDKQVAAIYSPDGKYLAVKGESGLLKILDAENGAELTTLSGQVNRGKPIFSGDRKRVATILGDTIRIWDIEKGVLYRTLVTIPAWDVAFSPDGKYLVSLDNANFGNKLRIWDIESGELVRTHVALYIGNDIEYSPNGERLMEVSSTKIRVWDINSGNIVWSSDKEFSFDVMYSPDGKNIVSTHRGEEVQGKKTFIIKIWDSDTGRELRTISGQPGVVIKSLDVSPNEKQKHLVIIGWENMPREGMTIKILDTENGLQIKELEGHTSFVDSVAYSPDGKYIVSGGNDFTVKVWDAETGEELRTFIGHTGNIDNIAFTSDGKQLISASRDNTIRLWDVSSGKEIAQFLNFSGQDTQLASANRGIDVVAQAAVSSNEGEWLAITPDGFYKASPRGDRYINVRVNDTVSGIDSYRDILYKPLVVEARLQGRPDPASKSNLTIEEAASIAPPQVTIQSPANFTTTTSASTTLSINVTSANQPIQTVRVFVNGRSAAQDELGAVKGAGLRAERTSLAVTGNQKQVNFTIPLQLDPGPNRIEVVAHNGYTESDRRRGYIDVTWNAPAGYQPVLPTLWILAVGVNAYEAENIRSLGCAVADAKGLVASLKAQEGKRYSKVNSLVIADGESIAPTSANIRENLKFLDEAGDRDVVLLFLAGHGKSAQEGKFFFLPKDAAITTGEGESVTVRESTAITGDEMITVLDGPGNRLLFIDACNSGGVDNDRMIRTLQESNAFVFAASKGHEVSQEASWLGHGFFTYNIMAALSGRAPAALARGNVSVLSMSGFVSIEVPRLTAGQQNPVLYSLGSADFPMAVIK